MSENKLLQTSLHVRGRANQLFSVKFIEFSVRGGPSKILHPLQRGCHTRLTIRNKSKTNLMVRRAGLSRRHPLKTIDFEGENFFLAPGKNLPVMKWIGHVLFAKKWFFCQMWPRQPLKHFTAAYRGFPPCTQSQYPINRETGYSNVLTRSILDFPNDVNASVDGNFVFFNFLTPL